MALEDMSISEVLVRYLRNMAEIERLKSEDLQISTTTDSIEEPRYVENLAQWEEYRATKEEITRLSEERKANINEKKQALFEEQREIRAFLRHNERVPKDKWIRCADEGVYVPGDPANGEPAVRVASWEHIMETNGEPERLNELRREKESTFWGRLESVRRDPRRKPVALAALATLILLTLVAGRDGFTFGVIMLGALATWWFLETRKQLREARGLLHETGTSEQLRVAQAATGKSWTNLLRIVIAIFLPPLSVLSQVGIRKHFWINILLTIFGYIPGIIHALWIIAKYHYNEDLSVGTQSRATPVAAWQTTEGDQRFELPRTFEQPANPVIRTVPKRQPIPKSVKMYVWQRDMGRCVECGSKEKLEYDHIIPLSKGGSNTERNLQLLCEGCNRIKGGAIG
jgi:uncharacterized membrane protein YqaE (UPF0057 family)/5-methylcytosine-specific restriction endonuclease McrA